MLQLKLLDIVVMMMYLVSVTILGLYFTRRQRTTRDYFLGGRSLPWWAVTMSIVATETSAVTVISVPGIAFNPNGGNFHFIQVAFGYLVGRILLAWLFIPRLYRGEYFTVYGFLGDRFGHKAQSVAVVTFFISRILATGIRIFTGALVAKIAFGLPITVSIVATSILALVYTVFGGFIAVVWTDVLQFIVYLIGPLLAIVLIWLRLPNGFSDVIHYGMLANKFSFFNFTLNPTVNYAFFAGLIGGCFLTMATHGTDQSVAQRMLACRTEKDSKRAIIGSGITVNVQFLFFLLLGVMLYAFYQQFDPKATFDRFDEVFPRFAITYLPIGFGGLVVAGIFAAAMSTVSSDINALANTTVNDIYKRYIKPQAHDNHYLLMSRIFTAFWGIVMILIGIAASGSKQTIIDMALQIPSYTFGALLGIFLLGLLTKRANELGAILGAIAGACTVLLAAPPWPLNLVYKGILPLLATNIPAIGNAFLSANPSLDLQTLKLAWPWYAPLGCLTTILVGYLISRLSFGKMK
ncbi:MAG: sodium:solute symporter [bacterium]|nr:sodium:solute symporter [bacterium]